MRSMNASIRSFGLQFFFGSWLFLVDGCDFASFFFFFLQWARSATGESLAVGVWLRFGGFYGGVCGLWWRWVVVL